MTMPDERTRSLRWAHELLITLSTEDGIPSEIQGRARSIGAAFPSPQMVQSLIAENAERLPSDWATAIEDARTLFVDLQIGGFGSPAIRKDVLYTLRHFPLAGSAASLTRGRFDFGIESWVAKDAGSRM